jgi:hypothetical protein
MINLHRASYHCEKNNKRKHDQLLNKNNVDSQIIDSSNNINIINDAVTEIVPNNSIIINDDHSPSINNTVNTISNVCLNDDIISHEQKHNDDYIDVVDDNINIDSDKNKDDNIDIIDDNVHVANTAITLDVDSIRKRLSSFQKTHQIYYEDQIQKKENIHCMSEKTKSVRNMLSVFFKNENCYTNVFIF